MNGTAFYGAQRNANSTTLPQPAFANGSFTQPKDTAFSDLPPALDRTTTNEIVKFETNLPVKVAFSRAQPDQPIVPGRYGDQVMYFLNGGGRIYLPVHMGEHIARIDPKPGEPLIVCKREVKTGQRKHVEWSVQRAEMPQEPAQPPQPLPSGQPPEPPPQAPQTAASAPGNQPTPPITNTQLCGALKTAIAAAAEAEAFAKSLEYSVRFTSEDLRAMAITVLIGIQQCQNGGRR